jgi:hypothetical protein
MKRPIRLCPFFMLLYPLAIVQSVSLAPAANLIYDANDADIAKTAGNTGTGVQDVAGAATAMPHGGTDAVIFAGHGEAGVIGLGSGTESGYHRGRDLTAGKLGDVAASLNTIDQHLNAGSIVVLSGCQSGSGNDGTTLIEQLSGYFTHATVFANKNCVAVTAKMKANSICTVEGKEKQTYWQQSSTIAAQKGHAIKVGRDEIKALVAASCAP